MKRLQFMIVRVAPVDIRHYSDKVMYPGYAWLIKQTNKRRPKRTK